jgi:predicted RNA binding protein YcfA (HicA-like mRNA interferase family)
MGKLPVVSGRDAVIAFEKAGWYVDRRAKGSHIIMKKEGMITTLSIPDHKVLDRGLLRSLIRDAFMSVEEFTRLL